MLDRTCEVFDLGKHTKPHEERLTVTVLRAISSSGCPRNLSRFLLDDSKALVLAFPLIDASRNPGRGPWVLRRCNRKIHLAAGEIFFIEPSEGEVLAAELVAGTEGLEHGRRGRRPPIIYPP
jgi:hypothetical protein